MNVYEQVKMLNICCLMNQFFNYKMSSFIDFPALTKQWIKVF